MPSGLASACSKMRPWSNLRAAPLPDDTIFCSTPRSSSVRVTRNLAMGELLLSNHNPWREGEPTWLNLSIEDCQATRSPSAPRINAQRVARFDHYYARNHLPPQKLRREIQ